MESAAFGIPAVVGDISRPDSQATPSSTHTHTSQKHVQAELPTLLMTSPAAIVPLEAIAVTPSCIVLLATCSDAPLRLAERRFAVKISPVTHTHARSRTHTHTDGEVHAQSPGADTQTPGAAELDDEGIGQVDVQWDAPELIATRETKPHRNICRVWNVFRAHVSSHTRTLIQEECAAKAQSTLLQAFQQTQWYAEYTVRDYHPVRADEHFARDPSARDFGSLFRLALELARAVACLRSAGIVHRDVKPDNVLMGADGRALLNDAGTAVLLQDVDRMVMPYVPGAVVSGAPAFTPPEVLAAAAANASSAVLSDTTNTSTTRPADAKPSAPVTLGIPYDKADVWSAAVTVLSLALGRHPWPRYPFGASEDARGAARPSYLVLPAGVDLPKHFLDLLTWAAWPHPSVRITAAALVARLEALATGAPPPSLLITALPWPWSKAAPAASSSAESENAGNTLLINVKDTAGHIVAVPLPLEQSGRVTFGHVALAAAEMLRITGPALDYSLLHAGAKIDPAVPVGMLQSVFQGTALILAPGLSQERPTIVVPGIGAGAASKAPTAAPRPAPGAATSGPAAKADATGGGAEPPGTAGAAAAEAGAAPGGAAAASSSVALPVVTVSSDRTPMFTFHPSEHNPAISLTEGNTVATCSDKWSTAFLSHPGLNPERSGKYLFAVRLLFSEPGTGCAVGVADAGAFDPATQCLGAHAYSWAYSKTGKIANGRGKWEDYGEAFATGDIITVEVDCREGRIKFYRNGVSQGPAFYEPELRGATLKPAVCIGGASGKTVRVQLVTPEVREFDRWKAHHRIQFSEDCTTVYNSGKWASALAAHPGISHGRMSWTVRLDDTKHGAGVAVGVVCADKFDWERQNLGASPNSWCFSKTGKKGDGAGFKDYGKPFSSSDTITVNLDMDACTLGFAVNGEDQGVAYDATSGIGSCPLVPAVCLGSTEGGKLAKVSLVSLSAYSFPTRFDRFMCSTKVRLVDAATRVETTDKWGTVFLDHPGISAGKFSFGIHITSAGQGCGAGLGFADQRVFKPQSRNLGAAEFSWCYSKTGKKSGGVTTPGFEAYGAPFKTGDTVTAEVDMDAETIRFYVNGHDQGVAFTSGLAGRKLVPAVVLGSSDGGHFTQLSVAPPAVTRLDTRRCNKHITFANGDRTAQTDSRWCSTFADHPGSYVGVVRFAVRLDGEGGAAVGFADATMFKPHAQNLGASLGTWALSKTGKISAGDADGFKPFTEKLVAGDVIGVEADMTEGSIRFWRNGVHLGAAFAGLAGRGYSMVPAVCIGSNSGGKLASVTLVEFDPAWVRGWNP